MKPSTTYDLKKGQELWNEGLKELNKKKVTLTLVTDDQTISKNVGQFVQSQVETKLKGAEVDVVSVPEKSANDKVSNGNFDMNYTLWLAILQIQSVISMYYLRLIHKIMVNMLVSTTTSNWN